MQFSSALTKKSVGRTSTPLSSSAQTRMLKALGREFCNAAHFEHDSAFGNHDENQNNFFHDFRFLPLLIPVSGSSHVSAEFEQFP
jgi:hypothetical protein